VEIFKDESAGRCRACGHKFLNPGADFGCAQWCSLAKECLGFAPTNQGAANSEGAFAAKLLQWAQSRFPGQPARFARVLRAFQHAKDLVRKEGGNPRVALSAAILLAAATYPAADGPAAQGEAEAVLKNAGVEQDTLGQVSQLVAGCVAGTESETIEFRIVRDANALARILAEPFAGGPEEWDALVQTSLRTTAAKDRARALFSA
jgi:hypothetical protein